MPRKLGERRHVPEKLIDSWTYKVKDVELEQLERVPLSESEEDDIQLDIKGKDTRTFDEKYRRVKARVKNKLVTVNVYMVKTTEQSEEPPHPLRSVRLLIKVPELNIKIEGTDIEAMKDAVWSMLDEKFEIQWERYYRVEVARPYIHDDGNGVAVSYDDIYKGTTWDGKPLLKRWRGHEFHIEPWPGAFKDENGKVMACIPATKENEAALKEFCSRVDVLRERLADFLKPDVIQENLLRLAGCALLPPVPVNEKEAS